MTETAIKKVIISALCQILRRRNQRSRDDGACSALGKDEKGMEENTKEGDCIQYIGLSRMRQCGLCSADSGCEPVAGFCKHSRAIDIGRSVYHFLQSNEIHIVVKLIKYLFVLRCQLYMFRTVTVQPQELLCRYCMCRLWYVLVQRFTSWTYQVVRFLTTYHSLHIQFLQRSS